METLNFDHLAMAVFSIQYFFHPCSLILYHSCLCHLELNIMQLFPGVPTLQVNDCDMYKSPSILSKRVRKFITLSYHKERIITKPPNPSHQEEHNAIGHKELKIVLTVSFGKSCTGVDTALIFVTTN